MIVLAGEAASSRKGDRRRHPRQSGLTEGGRRFWRLGRGMLLRHPVYIDQHAVKFGDIDRTRP